MENLEISTNSLLLVEEREFKLGQGRKACAKEMIFPAGKYTGVHSGGIAKLLSRLKEKLL